MQKKRSGPHDTAIILKNTIMQRLEVIQNVGALVELLLVFDSSHITALGL